MADKLMYNRNDDTPNSPFVDYNKGLKSLDTQLNKPTNQNSIEVLKVVKPTKKKTLLYNFGDKFNKHLTTHCPISLIFAKL